LKLRQPRIHHQEIELTGIDEKMGCGPSKNMDAQIAGDFFGATESFHNRESANYTHNSANNSTPEGASNRVPVKSNLKTSAFEHEEEPLKQKKLSKTKKTIESPPQTTYAVGGGTPSTASRKSRKGMKSGGTGSGELLNIALKKNTKIKDSEPRSPKSSKSSSPPALGIHKVPITAYKAPPPAESFVANPPPKVDLGLKMTNITVTAPEPPPSLTSQSVVSVPPPPPPPLSTNSVDQKLKPSQQDAMQAIKPIVLDDDDFSVAPSLAVEMRSICETKFDDVYQRGKKVSKILFLFRTLARWHRLI
jgi:hypothetical protein